MARLLTADEIRMAPRLSIIWVEFYNAEEGEPTQLLAAMKCKDGMLIDEDGCWYEDFEKDMEPNSGGWWRFWNEEPSEQEREDTLWEN